MISTLDKDRLYWENIAEQQDEKNHKQHYLVGKKLRVGEKNFRENMCGGRKAAAQLQLLEEGVGGGEVVVVLDQLVVARVLNVARVALHDRAHLDVEAA